jgi:luciferase family oxidoreductase group 1
MIPLSLLDLSPVSAGSTAAQALRNSLDLARHADELGFKRYWVAEHHNLPAIASSAPDIMIGQIAAVTRTMRIGSGGVMLPNHAPLMVAERFKVLEALYPGRIDLGLGRAPGTDPATSYALRRRQGISEEDDFLDRFNELMMLETRAFPAGHPFHNVRAMPSDVPLPPIYLLGSSDYSAQLAGHIGAAFSFAHHFANFDAAEAMRLYRDNFKPSPSHDKPYCNSGDPCGLRRYGWRGRATGGDRRSQHRASRQRRISAAGLAGRRGKLRLHARRPGTHGTKPHPAFGRFA